MTDIHAYNRLIRPVNDPQATDAMLTVLVGLTPEQQKDFWIRDPRAGHVCIYMHPSYPGKVIEYVQGSRSDSITTLYAHTPLFASRQSLVDARNTMITEIAAATLSMPDSVAFHDFGREREVVLREMGTAQLIDQWARIKVVNLSAIA